jgi:hypothetical protein
MKRCGGWRGIRRGPVFTAAFGLALLAAVVAAAFAAAGCGGSSRTADLAPFLGRWDRVEAGAPNADFTLDVERAGTGVRLMFTDRTNGISQTVAGTGEDGYVACTLATTDDSLLLPAGAEAPSPGVATAPPTSVSLQLSIDEGGQLIVDLVLADGTLQPIWIYQPADGVSPSTPGTP